MDEKKSTYWWLPIVFGVLFLALGLWMLIAPEEGMVSLMNAIGIIAIMSGTAQLIFTLTKHQGIPGWGFQVIGGIIDLTVGILLVTNPGFLLRVVSFLVAFWLLANGIIHLWGAGSTGDKGQRTSTSELVFGVLLILLALLFVWHPLILGITITIWIALAFIVLGLFRIFLTFRLKNLEKRRKTGEAI